MLDQYDEVSDLPVLLPGSRVAIDTETTGLSVWHGARVFCLSIVFPNGRKIYWHRDMSEGTRHAVESVLRDSSIHKVMVNAKFDCRMLKWSGFPEVRGPVWDVQILAHLLDGRDAGKGTSMDSMCRKYLPAQFRKLTGEVNDWFAQQGIEDTDLKDFSLLPPDLIRRRVESDAELTLMLFDRLYTTVRSLFSYLLWLEHRLLPVVMRMEDRGVEVDMLELERQYEYFTRTSDDVIDFFEAMTGEPYFNLHGRADQFEVLNQVGVIEYLERDPNTVRTPKTKQPKLNDFNLRNTKHPVALMLLVGKACLKLRDTFLAQIERFAVDGVLHPNFNQIGTCSGRFSCSKPNMQNIPIDGNRRTSLTEDEAAEMLELTGIEYAPHIKRIFRTRDGHATLYSDKCQAEMCMLAHYAGDVNLSNIVRSGENIHSGLCRLLYNEFNAGLKTRTKAVVFGFVYGAGLKVIAQKIGDTIDVARDTKERLASMVPGLPSWRARLESQIHHQGYVETIHGRRHYLTGSECYKSVNRVCQGTVGDEIKGRMVDIDKYRKAEGIDINLLLQIHDDLATEIPEDIVPKTVPDILRIMHETHHDYEVPLAADCNITYTRWSDKMDVDDPSDIDSYSREAHSRYMAPKLKEEQAEWDRLTKAFT